jgi:hypothetical protein
MKSYRRVDGRIGSGRDIHGGAAAFAFHRVAICFKKLLTKKI